MLQRPGALGPETLDPDRYATVALGGSGGAATLAPFAVDEALRAETAARFESRYHDAGGDQTAVPWADGAPAPPLVSWLNHVAPSLLRCGARVVVVGCGLGENVRELARRGYDVIGFDLAASAINWARALDPTNRERYLEADLFDLPPRWRRRFDLVVEINVLHALPESLRPAAMHGAASLASPHGHVLTIGRAATSTDAARTITGPPWSLSESMLHDIADAAGLTPDGDIAIFEDDEDPPVLRYRAMWTPAR